MTVGSHEWVGLTLAGGRYRITAKLGEGGMGFVYRALDQNIDAEVVIKAPRQAMMDDPEFAGRFTREIRSLVKLSHPHIVKVTDVGTYEETPFAVMQYLAGGSLEDRRPTGPDGRALPCKPAEISRWLTAVAEALDYIHTQGYVHRDVKPGNILFDTVGHAFLSDFGVAKVVASSKNPVPSHTAMTGAGMVLGTPEYMAPELIMGDPFDGRADQYALAVTVYEMLCGRRPFEHDTKTKVLVLHTATAPPPLNEWCPALPDRLSQAVLKGLAKNAANRYTLCAEFAGAVSAAAQAGGSPDHRVRLKCPACGRTGSMPLADFDKLKESGRRAICPACKSPIEVPSGVHAAPAASSGGTLKFSATSHPGECAPTSSQEPTVGGTAALTSLGAASGERSSPRMTQIEHTGTTALSALEAQRAQPSSGENTATQRRGSGTLIERTLPQTDKPAATVALQNLAQSPPERTASPPPLPDSALLGATAIPAWVWVAGGVGGTLLLLLVVFAASRFGPARNPDSTASKLSPKVAIADSKPQAPETPQGQTAAPRPAHQPSDQPAEHTSASLTNPSEPPPTPRPPTDKTRDERPELAGDPGSATAKSEVGNHPIAPKPAPRVNKNNTTAVAKKVPQEPSAFADGRFDATLLKHRPSSPEALTLEKLLAAPRSHTGQIVVPAGMYNLSPYHPDHAGGPHKWVATERRVGLKKNSTELETSLAPFSVVELEPGLAERLAGLGADKWKDRVSILSLWIANNGACGVVKVEILEKPIPTVKRSGFTFKGVVEYETLVVTAEDAKPARGDVALWEKVGRMNWVAHRFKRQVDGYKRMLRDHEQNVLAAEMNAMFVATMRNAAIADQQQRQLQQRLTGRP
jgi:serine/threonine protein kinase